LLDSVVKERFDQVFRLNRGRQEVVCSCDAEARTKL